MAFTAGERCTFIFQRTFRYRGADEFVSSQPTQDQVGPAPQR